MAFKDLREWIKRLEDEGELKRVKTKVDWNLELAEIVRKSYSQRGPALLFENIKDHEHTRSKKFFAGSLATRSRFALMFGLTKETPRERIISVIRERLKQPLKPVLVETGPVKENILTDKDIDLFQFPVPKYHPLDGGRYIDTFCGVVTRDPDTGMINVGLYRGMVADKNKIGKYLIPHQHWGQHYLKYQSRGEPMPVAIVYGWDPVLPLVAGMPLSHPPTEYEVMGGLRQKPVELVKCETVDLEVPASAEIVVEGTISPNPDDYIVEGPFGEWTGYYGWSRKRPYVEVKCITHRNDPILQGQVEGSRPGVVSEGGYQGFYTHSALLWNYLEKAGVPGILDIRPLPNIAVRIRKMYEAHARQVAAAIWGSCMTYEFSKIIIVVDEDVDIHNIRDLELALRDRLDPKDDIAVWKNPGYSLDPSIPWELRDELAYGGSPQNKLLIDLTINWEKHPVRAEWGNRRYPPICKDTPKEIIELVERRWQEYGI